MNIAPVCTNPPSASRSINDAIGAPTTAVFPDIATDLTSPTFTMRPNTSVRVQIFDSGSNEKKAMYPDPDATMA
jgi:hypothetical protein